MVSVRIILGAVLLQACHYTWVYALCSSNFVEENEYPYKYFQTKTLYDTVRGNISRADRPAGCSPKAIVMFLRHGSRHPGADDVNKYQTLANLTERINATGNAELCKSDLMKIMKWKNWLQPSFDQDLASTGHDEMMGISERYADVFPELFSSNTSYRFISSNKERAIQSADAFKDGLFDKELRDNEINNRLTRFHDFCERYLTEIDHNDSVVEDVHAFMEGPVITEIADEFSRRLGIPRSEISNDLVKLVEKEGCTEEEWATGNNSAWCLAFTKQDFQAFEYGADMSDYLVRSFGNELNHKQSCRTKHFILSTLQNATMSYFPKGVFLFSHYMGLMSLLTEMKIIVDDGPFRSTDYLSKVDRKFRVSLYAPGSGNMAFILYDCGGEMKLQIFLNEKLVHMPLDAPAPDGLWNLEGALQYFGFHDRTDCQFEKICSYENSDETTTSSALPSDTRVLERTTLPLETQKAYPTNADVCRCQHHRLSQCPSYCPYKPGTSRPLGCVEDVWNS